jgi:hypothetical protein
MSDDGLLRIADLRVAIDGVLPEAEPRLGRKVALPGNHDGRLSVDSAFDMTAFRQSLPSGSRAMTATGTTGTDQRSLRHPEAIVRDVRRASRRVPTTESKRPRLSR